MSKIEQIEKTINEIAHVLGNNEKLCRLLYIDSPDALTKPNFIKPTFQTLFDEKYINTTPQQQSGIQELGRNTFIILRISSLRFTEDSNNIEVYADCSIITNTNTVRLEGNRDRALLIADTIEEALTNHKFSSAGEIHVDDIDNVVYSEYEF
jgi:hypothetical protein